MKKVHKNLLSLGLLLLIVISITACGSKNGEVTGDLALLKDISGDNNETLLFEINNVDLKLKTDSDKYKNLEKDEFYVIAYDDDNKLRSAKLFDFNYREDEKHILDEASKENLNPIAISEEGLDLEGFSLLDEYKFSFSDNDNIDSIGIYVDAEKDSSGELLFDDGNRWLLIARTDSGDYLLYDERLQFGNLDFHILTQDDDFYINLVATNTAGFKLIEYRYDSPSKTFHPKVSYQAEGNVNLIK